MSTLPEQVEALWARRDELGPGDADAVAVVTAAVNLLDRGDARVAEMDSSGEVVVHQWLKQAVLLLFKVFDLEATELGPFEYRDRIPLKKGFAEAGVRVLPGASSRWGSFLGRGVVLMPSYVNVGAWVGPGTMVDTWATVGSCAQIGRDTHLSGGVGIGGVLEPPQAAPVMVGDSCLIGSRAVIAEGARVGDG
ncbi:MAG: 2,3,4,5-tetrahydropyridine-2,6-dicarboxylate N-succinyltransferase, partial [Acidimicrobiales bacterium]